MLVNFLTIFPDYFQPFLQESLIKKALEKKIVTVNVIDIRNFADDKYRKIDDTVYGGAPGMLIKVEPVVKALESCGGYKILLTPQGKVFDQSKAQELAKHSEITLVAGRYEGFDQRVNHFIDEELSIGDFVLNGGELAAMVVAECVVRLVPGVVGNPQSLLQESFSEGLLDFDQYTKPQEFRGLKVPEILLSGDHNKILEWQQQNRIQKTKEKRPDLWKKWLNVQGKTHAK